MAEFVELQYTNDSVQSSPAPLLPGASGRGNSRSQQIHAVMQTSRPSNKDFQRINQQEPDCKVGDDAPQQFYSCPEGDIDLLGRPADHGLDHGQNTLGTMQNL